MTQPTYVIGLDFGTDSVRTLIVNALDGTAISSAVHYYERWKAGKYCNAAQHQFRQHPLDYIESMEFAIKEAIHKAPEGVGGAIVGIAVDTTGSTPCAVDEEGLPLAMHPEFAENPHAMFILWKDHTGMQEADEINALSRKWEVDYTRYSGGIYSSEWFWAKILRTVRTDEMVREAAFSWVEHCDWIPFLLTGGGHVRDMKRSRCAAGHKALWHPDWGGLPPNDFFVALDPLLDGVGDRLFSETETSDIAAGTLNALWAQRLGLNESVVVGVGAFDAHMGAVGGEIEPYYLSKIMGTSTCDILVAPSEDFGDKLVPGICGQVDGSVIPGMLGLEAGQSAFGDIYAWFRSVLSWPIQELIGNSKVISEEVKQELIEEALDRMIPELSKAAEVIDPQESGIIALDWMNGRRTPDANQSLKGAIMGLNLASDAPRIFRALVEATCFGALKIIERFQEEGIPIKGVIGLGGVAKKSPFIMQTMADVLNRPIKIVASEQTCALGAAMFAGYCSRSLFQCIRSG